ncbi:MAG: hypothetical protein ACRCWC_08965, partial [Plesiomonas shigelloides]
MLALGITDGITGSSQRRATKKPTSESGGLFLISAEAALKRECLILRAIYADAWAGVRIKLQPPHGAHWQFHR